MKLVSIVLSLLVISATLSAAASADEKSQADIHAVVASFQRAIVAKDADGFMTLFYGEVIPWIGVYDESSLQRKRKKNADQAKARALGAEGPRSFINGIVKSAHRLEEKFWDVSIDSDDMVASVSFNYSFHANDYKRNWGREMWQLVHTDTGWKITSVIFSLQLNPEPPPWTTPAN